ncbi:hypothetical protein [Halegenticoccus soli]|uniref:hypothetical protein n=1 Tax=Halegenticoccus soli TaxID=1985678 RepID=UPI000C6DAD31|nr:hypothetical protein [Halegenticoccus soli]
MSVQKRPEVVARADLTVLVSRHTPGDLREGVTERIRRIEGVTAVDDLDVRGLRPGLNDLAVEATVTVTLRPVGDPPPGRVDDDAVSAQLADGFGVKRADAAIESVRGADRG